MRKRVFLFVIVLIAGCLSYANAQIRTPDDVRQIAQKHFSAAVKSFQFQAEDAPWQMIPSSLILNRSTSGATVKSISAEAFYVCVGEQGFVIISGDNRMQPILGYSDRAGFDIHRIPTDMHWLLSGYAAEFEALQGIAVQTAVNISTSGSNLPLTVSSLLDSKSIAWAQDAPFNDQCPVVEGGRAVTGCVATAMAMVMMYHEYPSKGKGEMGGFDLGSYPFDWSAMKNMGTSKGRQEVSRLMLFCGLSVGSTYSLNETTAPAQNILKALLAYFEYSNGMQYVSREAFLTNDWNQLLKKEIAQGRPVTYSGYAHYTGGHCFVLDGYDQQDLFHVNWGWGGAMNGFYTLTALRPGFSGPGTSLGGFNVGQGAVIGIKPPSGENEYTSNILGLGSAFLLSKYSMPRNASFDIPRILCINYSPPFTGDIQPALFNNNQLVSTIGNPFRGNQVPFKSAPGDVSFSNVTIPPQIPNGVYQLRMVTKDVRESQWQQMRMSQTETPYYVVSVTSSDVTFTNPVNMNALSMTFFERENNLYYHFGVGFKITIVNAGSEWMGHAGVQLQVADKSEEPVVVAQDRLVFMSGENHFQLLETALPLSKGDYIMQPVYSINGVHWFPLLGSKAERVSVDVADFNAFALSLKACKPVRMTLTEKDPIQFELTIQNSGAGPFNDRIRVEIFNKKNPNLFYTFPTKDLFIDKNKSVSFVMEYLQRLPDGDYQVNVQYLHFLQGAKSLAVSIGDFTVRSLSGL